MQSEMVNEGDENTAYFHRIVTSSKRRNYIAEILSLSGNSRLLNDSDIEAEFVGFYRNLFTNRTPQIPLPIVLDWSLLLEADREEKIYRAINDLGINKSPRLDGFNG